MPTSAQERFAYAFTPIPTFSPRTMSRAQRIDFNQELRRIAPVIAAQRLKMERVVADMLAAYLASEYVRIAKAMHDTGGWEEIVARTVGIYNGQRIAGESDSATRAKVRKYLKANEDFDERIVVLLKKAAAHTSGYVGGFEEWETLLNAARVLFMEAVLRPYTAVIRGASTEVIVVESVKEFTIDDVLAMSIEDVALVNIVFPDWPALRTADSMAPELKAVLADRTNMITAAPVSDKMFDNMKDTIRVQVIDRAKGGIGAEALARKLIKDLEDTYGSGAVTQSMRDRAMLWARTEGAIMQNDALMARGKSVKMDGKIWQTVGDSRVRPEHSMNENDGVIPVDQAFSDGSMDGGAGSRSPFNCRCAVGPALLEEFVEDKGKKPVDTKHEAVKPAATPKSMPKKKKPEAPKKPATVKHKPKTTKTKPKSPAELASEADKAKPKPPPKQTPTKPPPRGPVEPLPPEGLAGPPRPVERTHASFTSEEREQIRKKSKDIWKKDKGWGKLGGRGGVSEAERAKKSNTFNRIAAHAGDGVEGKTIGGLSGVWNGSSNSSLDMYLMQDAVTAEFGGSLSAYQSNYRFTPKQIGEWIEKAQGPNSWDKSYIMDATKARLNTPTPSLEQCREVARDIARAIWEETQEHLKAQGVEYVNLIRGARFESAGAASQGPSGMVIQQNPLNSWTTSEAVASKFNNGGVVEGYFHRERIFSTIHTGFGTDYEYEVVVMGDALDDVLVLKNW